jgi:hypothetical protein
VKDVDHIKLLGTGVIIQLPAMTTLIDYADHCRAVEDAVKAERERIIEALHKWPLGILDDFCVDEFAQSIRQQPVAARQKEEGCI